jgi:multidrug efflux pump subunit AcrA (membrane-fusion protein)
MKKIFLLSLLFVSISFAETFQKYEIVSVKSVPLNKRIILGGTVISKVAINLSSQTSGDVIEVKGKEGSFFKKGDILIGIENVIIKAKMMSVYAEIEFFKQQLRNADVQYSKSIISPDADANRMLGGVPGLFNMVTGPVRNIVNQGDTSFEKYAKRINSYTNYEKAKKHLKQAFSKLKEVQKQLENTQIKAPFDGVIVEKNVNEGDTVFIGQKLLKFSNIRELQVAVNMPTRLIPNLQKEILYNTKIQATNFDGWTKLVQIYPIADSQSHTVKTKFDLPKGVVAIIGSYAEVHVIEKGNAKEIPVITNTAIIWRSSLPSVYIVNRKNELELRFIRLGDKISDKEFSVLSGISAGDRVIKNPNFLIKSGLKIN